MKNYYYTIVIFLFAINIALSQESKQFHTNINNIEITDQHSIIKTIPSLNYHVIGYIKRKPKVFTQGLLIENNTFYESSGRYKRSYIKKYTIHFNKKKLDKASKKVKKISNKHFAEGITIFDNDIYLLTWQSGTVYQLSKNTLTLKNTLNIQGEGWGLTSNDQHLILSNGSNKLHFYNKIFKPVKSVNVVYKNNPIQYINELEWVNQSIYANVWQNNNILAINSNNGKVRNRLDISPLIEKYKLSKYGVLNGIAYHKERNSLFITGKLWPYIFEIKPKNW